MIRRRRRGDDSRGQSLVEFSLALIPFMFILMGAVDLGRGIFTNNGVAEAAREIARTASVHPCTGACTSATWSADILDTVNVQSQLVPGLTASSVTITCTDLGDAAVTVGTGKTCPAGDYVKVSVSVTFRLVTPFLPVPNPMTFTSTSHVQIQ